MKFFKNGYRPTNKERNMFEGVMVMGDGFMSRSENSQWVEAVRYFAEKGAIDKFDNERHEQLQDKLDFYRSLWWQSNAEGRHPMHILDEIHKIQGKMKEEGFEIF